MKIEEIIPSCNLDTVKDGRGGIFTFIPKDPIVEFNYNIIKAGKVRGNHYHPEFDEYYLVVSGQGVLVSKDAEDAKEKFIYLSPGKCTRTPKNISHVFLAITDCTLVVLLTKKWDDCEKPIVHENLGMGKGDHGDPESEYHKD
jgi:mannose-6-phosphate isomerase-like protein (cupin superfamily)|tara:strand:- start:1190 stop:1618 length:429 start_codon:yes stop_codon:yes gene_type:complete